jgi:hypothetical protein
MTLFPVNPKNLKGLGAEEVRRCANTPEIASHLSMFADDRLN